MGRNSFLAYSHKFQTNLELNKIAFSRQQNVHRHKNTYWRSAQTSRQIKQQRQRRHPIQGFNRCLPDHGRGPNKVSSIRRWLRRQTPSEEHRNGGVDSRHQLLHPRCPPHHHRDEQRAAAQRAPLPLAVGQPPRYPSLHHRSSVMTSFWIADDEVGFLGTREWYLRGFSLVYFDILDDDLGSLDYEYF